MAKGQPTAKAGKVLGRYRIERELGRGGMGVVYLARDENLQRRVALKTTSVAGLGSGERSRNQRRKRFIREVQALAQVSHENVVHVYDADEQDDPDLGWLLFYSMQFVDGITLAQLVQGRGAMDPAAAAAACMQVASGLGAAHHLGIVHRDVKPANIFLTVDRRALIGDFGICKIEGSTQITRRDQLVGTPNYLAPEQILGEAVTPATDVFALAALFYVVTTNRPLRTKVDPASLLKGANSNEAKDKMMREKRIPAGLRAVVARALERDPAKRYPDGNAFADALSDHASRIPTLGPEPSGPAPKAPMVTPTDTDPFAPIDRGAAVAPDANKMSAVEQAAQALLNEVGGQREAKKPSMVEAIAEPLPVAQTESTAMFNLRSYEEGKAKNARASLPVTQAEHSGEGAPLLSGSAFDDDTADGIPDDDTSEVLIIRDEQVRQRTRPQKPQRPEVPLPPLDAARVKKLTATAAASGALALFLVVLLYMLITPGRPTIPPPRLAVIATVDEKIAIPEECGKPASTQQARVDAAAFVEEALLMSPGRKRTQKLQDALAKDGHNHRAHFWLGPLMAKRSLSQSRTHYRCTAALDPEGQLGRKAKSVLENSK